MKGSALFSLVLALIAFSFPCEAQDRLIPGPGSTLTENKCRICHELESDSFQVEDLHAAITGRFRASYVVAQPRRTPRLVAALASDRRVELVLQTESEALFRAGR